MIGASALGASAIADPSLAQPRDGAAAGCEPSRAFPPRFLWGTATAAYQIEGAVSEDGRGPSIWDTFTHTPGKIRNDENGDVADDHYHRYRDDVSSMKALGATAYRFSISWPRIFPQGTGAPNPKGLDFYDRLLDNLVANGIAPFPTLYHWDLPQALQDRGGWESRDTAEAFADYAGYVAEKLSDRATHFFTLNECATFVELGHATGVFAPGLKLPPGRLNQVRHHALLAHGLAVLAIRARSRAGTQTGPAENLSVCVPVIETPEHIAAAELATRELNAPYLTAIMEGRYRESFLAAAGADAPRVAAEDMKTISAPVDFVGINVYLPGSYVSASDAAPGFVGAIPGQVSDDEFIMAQDRPRGALLGAAQRGQGVECEQHLHYRERLLSNRRAGGGRPRLRHRPHHVLAQLSDAIAARDGRRRAGTRLFPLEPNGQFRVGRRLWHPFRAHLRRLCHPATHAEIERIVLPGSRRPKSARLVRCARKSSGVP
jgi:beta-glucosidase